MMRWAGYSALAQSHDLVVRRNTVMETLNLRTGEKVLELGCGGGSYAFEAAQFVGPTGRISAIDISADQIDAARERCAGFAWVQCQIGNLLELPYQDGEFDAVYSVQVLEYVGDLGKAFREIHRVLRDGGRFVNISTNWSSCVWYSENKERMRRVLKGWSAQEIATRLDTTAERVSDEKYKAIRKLRVHLGVDPRPEQVG